MSMIKILGVCGTQRKEGNTERSLAEALQSSRTIKGVETELVSLANMNINACNGCRRCQLKGTKEHPCPEFDDAMNPLYYKMVNSDGFIFASPVYFGSVTSTMKAFMDRTLPFTTEYYEPNGSSEFKTTLRLRPAAAIAVSVERNDGIETTLSLFYRFFLYHDMVLVGAQIIGNEYATSFGGALVSENKPDAITLDNKGIGTIRAVGKKVAILAKALKPIRVELEKRNDF